MKPMTFIGASILTLAVSQIYAWQDSTASMDPQASPAVRCVTMAYNHYMYIGFQPRTAWNNAIRDCQRGLDPSCLLYANDHYKSEGASVTNAWNNAIRDCRELLPANFYTLRRR